MPKTENDLKMFSFDLLPMMIVWFLLVLVHFFSGGLVLLAFILGVVIFAYNGFDERIPIALTLILLSTATITLAMGREELAYQVASYSYYFLVMGALILLIDFLKEG